MGRYASLSPGTELTFEIAAHPAEKAFRRIFGFDFRLSRWARRAVTLACTARGRSDRFRGGNCVRGIVSQDCVWAGDNQPISLIVADDLAGSNPTAR